MADSHKGMREIEKFERKGKQAEALEAARRWARELPEDDDFLDAYWRLARAQRKPADINAAAVKLMKREMGLGNNRDAFLIWQDVMDLIDSGVSLGLVNKLAGALIDDDFLLEAEELIERGLDRAPNLPPEILKRTAAYTLRMKNKLGFKVIDAALAAPQLTPQQKQEFSAMREELAQLLDDGGMDGELAVSDFNPAPFTEEKVRNVHALKAWPVIPKALSRHAITVTLPNGADKEVTYDQIKVIGVGVIMEGAKPYLLVDLMFDPLHAVLEQHRVLRINSSAFDIRALLPQAPNPGVAFQKLVGGLLARSGADPIPSRDEALGQPYARYPSIRLFERKSYFPD